MFVFCEVDSRLIEQRRSLESSRSLLPQAANIAPLFPSEKYPNDSCRESQDSTIQAPNRFTAQDDQTRNQARAPHFEEKQLLDGDDITTWPTQPSANCSTPVN